MTPFAAPNRLAAIPPFAGMRADRLSTLFRGTESLRLAKGEELADVGDRSLLALASGAVAMGVREEGETTLFATIDRPTALNLACVMASERCDIVWRALKPAEILVVPVDAFRFALAEDARFAARAYADLALAFQRLLDGAVGQRLRSADRRVANYLSALAGSRTGVGAATFPCEKRLVAALLGMTPEKFSRSLGRLSDYGVTIDGPAINITSTEQLRLAATTL